MRALILAAGLGSRFRSKKAKVLHTIMNKPMVWYVYQTIKELNVKDIGVVVGHQAEEVKKIFEGEDNLLFFTQKNPKGGTADAVISAIDFWRDYQGYLLVINGDNPLVKSQTIKNMQRYIHLVEEYENIKLSALILSSFFPDPTGYGRVVKDSQGNVIKIVEEKDASFEEKQIKEINGGVYLFYSPHLLNVIFSVKPSPVSGELYLTEVINLMSQRGFVVRSFMAEEQAEVMGVNNRWELAIAENVIRLRIIEKLAKEGNTIHQPETVWIEPSVVLEGDVEIEPGVAIMGNSRLGKGVRVGRGSIIQNSILEEGVIVEPYSVVKDSYIKSGAVVGPFAHVRNQSVVGERSHVGNFVEVKASNIGNQVNAKHLAYIGDATIGDRTNVGAGVVFANYDGKKKYQSYVGENVFIGSNSLIIAPIQIGSYSYIAGGSVINKNIEGGALAIARAKLKVLKDKGKEKLTQSEPGGI
ncbi:bifunctional UDP-N-acetylglucosamine diphosphorylase/glucosamine-1-phosphate N-acetyltransferase GlmU [Thermocrinis jamiesonii]|uniref:bifunctional UDP-N-acetylglucosamine diphosphorylase/glucosamine-1-phosphate N-acetyltransferase GlmU n=1 Tax=Thermocrinis jamiesonii TaxID=1302351 RepID=UPI000496B6CC|nr:bifunctional UDP-N-acetylglucosamine diphosphorylase/glucosamine-1-phosphate N-acetyltransferase GlmU [Thermocrinis jamiesonii]